MLTIPNKMAIKYRQTMISLSANLKLLIYTLSERYHNSKTFTIWLLEAGVTISVTVWKT